MRARRYPTVQPDGRLLFACERTFHGDRVTLFCPACWERHSHGLDETLAAGGLSLRHAPCRRRAGASDYWLRLVDEVSA